MKQADLPLYIRFGEIPESGRSRIHLDDNDTYEEPGLSVWRAVECSRMYFPVLPEDANENAVMDYFRLILSQDRSVYLVTGDEMRLEGQDREPLLQNAIILKDITNTFRSETWN